MVEIIAGLILLPLLIAAIMLLFKRPLRPCPGCRAMIPDDATRCRHCGFGFETASDESRPAPLDEEPWNPDWERSGRSRNADEEPESSILGAVSCVLCHQTAPAGDCVLVPERGPLCSTCVDAVISATTPTEQR